MSAITVLPATLEHAAALAPRLRPADEAEVRALGMTPHEMLRHSIELAVWAEAYMVDGRVAAIAGLNRVSLLSDRGIPWLLTGALAAREWNFFLRHCRATVRRMLSDFPTLANTVHAEHHQAVRWLRWLGFTVEPEAVPLPPYGQRFHHFKMERLTVQESSVSAVMAAANFGELAAEYGREAAIDGMPAPTGKMEAYRHLESAGMLHVFSATMGRQLVGFISVLASVLPRYGVAVAVSESFFVAKAHRKTGAGLKLLRAAEKKARDLGSPGLLVSAPCGGRLFEILPRLGYAETNRVFFKKVRNA